MLYALPTWTFCSLSRIAFQAGLSRRVARTLAIVFACRSCAASSLYSSTVSTVGYIKYSAGYSMGGLVGPDSIGSGGVVALPLAAVTNDRQATTKLYYIFYKCNMVVLCFLRFQQCFSRMIIGGSFICVGPDKLRRDRHQRLSIVFYSCKLQSNPSNQPCSDNVPVGRQRAPR